MLEGYVEVLAVYQRYSQKPDRTFIYFIVHITTGSYMSTNILSTKENNLEKQEYPLVDKAYYVDIIAYKVDNAEQWVIDTD